MPVDRTGHLGRERLGGQRVVEVAGLAVEDVRVRGQAARLTHEVRVAVRGDPVDRILEGVRVEVADEQEVGVAAAGRVGGEPVDERLGGVRAGDVAVARAIAGVGVADRVAVGALRLEVVDDDRQPGPARVCSKVWASDGRLSVSMKRGSIAVVMVLKAPTGETLAGL